MNNMKSNKIRKQSAEQKAKQIERSKARFKEKVTERNIIALAPSSVEIEDVQREKRLRKRAQRQVEDKRKKLEQSKQTVMKQSKHLREFEDKIARLEYERFETKQKLSKIEEQFEVEIANRDRVLLKEQSLRKEAEKTVQNLILQRQMKRKGARQKVDILNQVKQLKESNKALRKQLESYDLWNNQEKYGNLEQELKSLRKEVHIFRNRERQIKKDPLFLVGYMKHYISGDYVPELLDIVRDSITTENLHHFYHGEQNVFYLLMRRVNLLNYHAQKRNNQYKLKSKTNSDEAQRLGFLTFENEKWQFVDATQVEFSKVYDIRENVSNEPLIIDRPVKATLQQDGVTIIKCFSMEAPKHTQHKKKYTTSSTAKKEYLSFGNFKVLIIGSRFLTDYKDRLAKHGCNAELHNPFEESNEVLKGKISRSEIILVCERHIPHGVWDHVDKKQPYVSVLKQDSKDLISTFTYLTLQRCELI